MGARCDDKRRLRGIRRRRKEGRALPEDLRRLGDVGVSLVVAVRRSARCDWWRRRRKYRVAPIHCVTVFFQRADLECGRGGIVIDFCRRGRGGSSRTEQRKMQKTMAQAKEQRRRVLDKAGSIAVQTKTPCIRSAGRERRVCLGTGITKNNSRVKRTTLRVERDS
jgi:hypothetical protein